MVKAYLYPHLDRARRYGASSNKSRKRSRKSRQSSPTNTTRPARPVSIKASSHTRCHPCLCRENFQPLPQPALPPTLHLSTPWPNHPTSTLLHPPPTLRPPSPVANKPNTRLSLNQPILSEFHLTHKFSATSLRPRAPSTEACRPRFDRSMR